MQHQHFQAEIWALNRLYQAGTQARHRHYRAEIWARNRLYPAATWRFPEMICPRLTLRFLQASRDYQAMIWV